MKLPRGVSGERLIRTLQALGYHILRQKGSHVRLRHDGPPPHSISVPLHDSLKVGTLQGILAEVAEKRAVTIDSLIDLL
jgi:predicted RNA binding protein YcfA (HicA-like mRNA interferase family)